MAVSNRTKLVLAFRSGDRCAFTGCGGRLSADGVHAGAVVMREVPHRAGVKPGASRYDAIMTVDQRDDYPNLIYLCPNHHTQIDKQEIDFSVEQLLQMKAVHERNLQLAMEEALPAVGFVEL